MCVFYYADHLLYVYIIQKKYQFQQNVNILFLMLLILLLISYFGNFVSLC